jgi:hypothetical protein
MTTRLDQQPNNPTDRRRSGYEGNDIPGDIKIPPCTIEDVDKAVFNLFNKSIPLQYKKSEEVKRVPVIYATGERFAVLRRKQPLRDKNSALILPLVSIMRTGLSQEVSRGMGPGEGAPMTIKRRLNESDPLYKRLLNNLGLKHQDDLATSAHRTGHAPEKPAGAYVTGSDPGTVASRRAAVDSPNRRSGRVLTPDLGSSIVEIIEIPPTKFFNATYDVTFWSQYTQQMNDMIMAMMSVYQDNRRRTFKLESDKGYWFVGYVGSDLSPGNNYDDFTDNERIVRYNFEIQVAGYVIAPEYSGAPAVLRRYVSAPEISFDVTSFGGSLIGTPVNGPASVDPSAYILNDLATKDDPLPGAGVGRSATAAASNAIGDPTLGGTYAGSDLRGMGSRAPSGETTMVGGHTSGPSSVDIIRITQDPFSGKAIRSIVKVKTRNQRQGETVYSAAIPDNLGDFSLND